MTNPVIDEVRRMLGRRAGIPMTGRPDIVGAREAGPGEAEIESFLGEVRKLSGSAARLARAEVGPALESLVREQDIQAATAWETPFLRELQIREKLEALGVEIVASNSGKQDLARCDLGVTEADFLLPETGTIVLRSSAEKPRAVSLLPRVHLAIVRPEMLRADMHQVFAEAKNDRYLVFITGPSRTADIELTVTLGVHGPRSLGVWMVEG